MYSLLTLDQNIKAFAVYDSLSDGVDAAFRRGKYAGAADSLECPHLIGTADHVWWNRGFDYGTNCLVHGLHPYADNSVQSG